MSSTPRIDIIKGDDQDFACTFTNEDATPYDLTGSTVMLTVKADIRRDDTAAIIQKDVTSHSDPTNGITSISLTAAETDVTAGVYEFDLQVVVGGIVKSTNRGVFAIEQDVTHRTS